MAGNLSDHGGIANGSRRNRDGLLRQGDLDCVDGRSPGARAPGLPCRIGSHFASECMGSMRLRPARLVAERECQINAERDAHWG